MIKLQRIISKILSAAGIIDYHFFDVGAGFICYTAVSPPLTGGDQGEGEQIRN